MSKFKSCRVHTSLSISRLMSKTIRKDGSKRRWSLSVGKGMANTNGYVCPCCIKDSLHNMKIRFNRVFRRKNKVEMHNAIYSPVE